MRHNVSSGLACHPVSLVCCLMHPLAPTHPPRCRRQRGSGAPRPRRAPRDVRRVLALALAQSGLPVPGRRQLRALARAWSRHDRSPAVQRSTSPLSSLWTAPERLDALAHAQAARTSDPAASHALATRLWRLTVTHLLDAHAARLDGQPDDASRAAAESLAPHAAAATHHAARCAVNSTTATRLAAPQHAHAAQLGLLHAQARSRAALRDLLLSPCQPPRTGPQAANLHPVLHEHSPAARVALLVAPGAPPRTGQPLPRPRESHPPRSSTWTRTPRTHDT